MDTDLYYSVTFATALIINKGSAIENKFASKKLYNLGVYRIEAYLNTDISPIVLEKNLKFYRR